MISESSDESTLNVTSPTFDEATNKTSVNDAMLPLDKEDQIVSLLLHNRVKFHSKGIFFLFYVHILRIYVQMIKSPMTS